MNYDKEIIRTIVRTHDQTLDGNFTWALVNRIKELEGERQALKELL